jgi:hypothetical protein
MRKMAKTLSALLAAGALAAGGLACERREAPPADPATEPAEPRERTAEPREEDREPVAGRPVELPEDVRELQSEVQQMRAASPDADHEHELRTLRQMADALESIRDRPDAVNEAAGAIRQQADQIEETPHDSPTHPAFTKAALLNAVAALDELQRQRQIQELQGPISSAREAVERIDTDRLFADQRQQIHGAFAQVSEAIATAARHQEQREQRDRRE